MSWRKQRGDGIPWLYAGGAGKIVGQDPRYPDDLGGFYGAASRQGLVMVHYTPDLPHQHASGAARFPYGLADTLHHRAYAV